MRQSATPFLAKLDTACAAGRLLGSAGGGEILPQVLGLQSLVDFHKPHDVRQLSGVSNPASEA